jgi:hypothetical protein
MLWLNMFDKKKLLSMTSRPRRPDYADKHNEEGDPNISDKEAF